MVSGNVAPSRVEYRWGWALSALVLVLASPGHLRGETFGELEIQAQTIPGGATSHGYLEVPVEIINHSSSRSFEVTLSMPGRGGGGGLLGQCSRTTLVGPGSRLRVSLFQPPLQINGGGISVAINGRLQTQGLHVNGLGNHMGYNSYHYARSGVNPPVFVLASREMKRFNLQTLYDTATGWTGTTSGGYRGEKPCQFLESEMSSEAWSSHWLAYSRYDGVMLGGTEMDRLPGEVRMALEGYVNAGGTLVVVGPWKAPDPWLRSSEDTSRFKRALVGFGEVLLLDNFDTANATAWPWTDLEEALRLTAKPWQSMRDVVGANREFTVADDFSVPVRGLLILMCIFAFLIGPVNILVLHRAKRRIWLLWTVPLASFVTCLLVFTYNMVAEGFTGAHKIQTITILDSASHRATTIGWAGFYSPLTPGGGLHFDADMELAVQMQDNRYGHGYASSGRTRTVDWTTDQHLESGWMISRVPAHFMLRQTVVGQEGRLQVEIRRDDQGRVLATNGLGVEIAWLEWGDEDGGIRQAANIQPGAVAELLPYTGAVRVSASLRAYRTMYASDWLGPLGKLQDQAHALVRPGTYTALVNSSPFVDQPLSRSISKPGQSLVVGTSGPVESP